MRIGYFDCFSGAAGDMILAAMIDAGCPLAALQEIVAKLQLPGVTLSAEKVKRKGIQATYATVHVPPEARKKHRHLPQINTIIDGANLRPTVASRTKAIFMRLAEAEAAVHGTTIEKVHFHEVGAADAIVDIVCASAGVELLGLESIACGPIPTGSGTVNCEHGIMPVPAPATANLLLGVPLAACEETGELTTPTGAAILTTLTKDFGPPPAMTIRASGYGAGTREGQTRPNVLRLLIGDPAAAPARDGAEHDTVAVLEAHVDDLVGQNLAYAAEQLLKAGALDVFIAPIIMKKGRPGQLITVLCAPDRRIEMENILFRQTSTFGIRRHESARVKLVREHATVNTSFGSIRVKLGRRGNDIVQAWPEYEDCVAAASRTGAALHDVQQESLRIWSERHAAQHRQS